MLLLPFRELTSSVSDDRKLLPQKLVLHDVVEIVAVLVLGQSIEIHCDDNRFRFAVIDGGTPGGAAPRPPDLGTLRLADLQRTVRATVRRKRDETTQREAVEGQLEKQMRR